MNKLSNRIFTFGCSFTSYHWPTWADIILYDNDGYNFGKGGAGYDHILYQILEADRKFKFMPNDQIIILLSAPIRWDMILNDGNKLYWSTNGLAVSGKNAKYENELFCIDGIIFKAYYNIQLIYEFLKSRNLNFIFGSIYDLFNSPEGYSVELNLLNETKDLINFIKNVVDIKLLNYETFIKNINFNNLKTYQVKSDNKQQIIIDSHPRPMCHFRWVTEILMKNVELELKTPIEIIEKIEKIIDEIQFDYEFSNINKLFPKLFENRINNDGDIYIKKNKFI